MTDPSPVNYEFVLADLRAKRDKIDAAIAGIEAMLGIHSASSVGEVTKFGQPKAEQGLGPGAFLGMTIADAAKTYLTHKRQNQRTEEILKALKDGGLILTSQDPLNTVGSILLRNYQAGGEIVRVSRGVWGLAAWHPRLKRKAGESRNGTVAAAEEEEEGASPAASTAEAPPPDASGTPTP